MIRRLATRRLLLILSMGSILPELAAGVTEVVRTELDLSQVSDEYLGQRIDT